jgi:phytanoyl-CoA hydroxylase
MTNRTTEQLLAAYNQAGYIHVQNALQPEALEPLKALIIQGVDDLAQTMLAKGEIHSLFEHEPFDRRLAALFEGREAGLRAWDQVIWSKALFDLICHPGIVQALEPLIGPDITFNGDYHLRPKLPESQLTAFPWHQDSNYYGEPTQHMHIVTVTVPLVDLTVENGCLWFIPGSHHWGYVPGRRGADQNMRPLEEVESRGPSFPAPMKVGDIMPFHHLTFHCSKLNVTNRVRWTLDLRYSATPGSRSFTAAEQSGIDYMFPRLKSLGFVPFTVQGYGGRPEWEEVNRQYQAARA